MLSTVMPVQLPPSPVPEESLSAQFSLPEAMRAKQPLLREVGAFQAWLTEPVQLNRPGAPLVPRSMHNILSHVYQYLGFMKQYRGKHPTLYHFLDCESYAAYISFQKAKGNKYIHIQQQIASARKTLKFLQIGYEEDDGVFKKTIAAIEWLSLLCKQLSNVLPQRSDRPDISELPAAHEVVLLIERVKQSALLKLPPMGQALSWDSARLMHDASLASLMFGYLPPIRLVCLRTLQMPHSVRCLVPGCLKPDCRGNKLIWQDGHLMLQLNHYKVERR